MAFANDPVKTWALPDGSVAFYRELIAHALDQDEVLVAERENEIVGVSAWQVLNSTDRIHQEVAELAELATVQPGLGRMVTAMRLLAGRHPAEPHVYLATMGVDPAVRGGGIGGALLRHRLTRADYEDRPTYLEASTERSEQLYARHGFRPLGAPIALAERGPRPQPMWRDPKTQPRAEYQ